MSSVKQQSKLKRKEIAIREAQQRKMRRLVLWTTAAVVVIVGLSLMLANGHKGAAETDFHYDKQPMLGKADAPVKVVEFGDFKCPTCQAFEQQFFPALKKDYLDTGIAQFYFINDPFIGPDSMTAALAAESVYHQQPEAFWTYYDALYKNQGDEKTAWATPDFLVDLAKKANLGVDYDKLKADIVNKTYQSDVNDDLQLANKEKVSGTPTIYVNGKEVDLGEIFNNNGLKKAIDLAKGAK